VRSQTPRVPPSPSLVARKLSASRREVIQLARSVIVGATVLALAATGDPAVARASTVTPDSTTLVIRVNQLGYLPRDIKVAVACGVDSTAATVRTFSVRDARGRTVLADGVAAASGPFGPCAETYRLDFSKLTRPGDYTIAAGGVTSPVIHIDPHAYDGAADTLLYYMREQRSGYNPVFRTVVHPFDGIVVDDSLRAGWFRAVTGGWADASDYLQYVTTSATATYDMLAAYRDHPHAFSDAFDTKGDPGRNGTPDVLDEARHGLEWLLRMFPTDGEMYNQIADDRDHRYFDIPPRDSSDYGWGKGRERPVYPCTGKPQGLFKYKNRSTGKASTAGKFASAMALGAELFKTRDPAFADSLRRRAIAAYRVGVASPGVCQTASSVSPYFYEEQNYVDDMELGAAELYALTHKSTYLHDAIAYAAREPVTPWMGADTARHYEWYPFHNRGHYAIWRDDPGAARRTMTGYYRDGLARVVARAHNGFRIGIPFIWCSNDLMSSFATQAYLYRRMSGDTTYQEYETAARDWLFGVNPWGQSMVIGLPASGRYPRDPHSAVSAQLHRELTGGLVDGPVYRSIFKNLKGIALTHPDTLAAFNTGFIVYHDDLGDYSTNEPIMDGTASLSYLLSALAAEPARGARATR